MKDLIIHGNWRVQETGNYKGGLRDGNWRFMLVLDGGLKMRVAEGQYYRGKKAGQWNYYAPNFKKIGCDLCASGVYDDGVKVGRWEYSNMQNEYFDRMKIRGYYLKNYPQELEHKPWTKYVEEYYPNGNIQEFGYIDNDGHKEGEWLYFYDNKNLKETGRHSSGKKAGTWKYYYKNGYPKEVGDYFRYERIGLWKYFSEKNVEELLFEVCFEDGKPLLMTPDRETHPIPAVEQLDIPEVFIVGHERYLKPFNYYLDNGDGPYEYDYSEVLHAYWKNKKYFHPKGLRAMQNCSGQLLTEYRNWNRKNRRVKINLTKVSRFSKYCR